MPRKKRKTRREKIKAGLPVQSKYAEKQRERRDRAVELGLSPSATWPEIYKAEENAAYQERQNE